MRHVPFVVPPSGKIIRGGYLPVSSMAFYLSPICNTILFNSSGVPPRSMNIKFRALNICPASGTEASSFFAAKEHPNTLFKMIVSTHEEWLQTIVGTC
jgi:hypothetical protein